MAGQLQSKKSTGGDVVALPTEFIALGGFAFAGSVAATIYFCRSMGGGMHMPCDWTMSMMWMRMKGQIRRRLAGHRRGHLCAGRFVCGGRHALGCLQPRRSHAVRRGLDWCGRVSVHPLEVDRSASLPFALRLHHLVP